MLLSGNGVQEVTPVSHQDDNAPPATAQTASALSRRAFVGLAGAAGLALAAGCGGGLKGSTNSSTGTIKIGYISPQTGVDAAFATAEPFVISKVRQALSKGITVGGKKYNVEIFTGDSQSVDTRAAQVAQQLITQHNVDIMLTTSAPETVNPVSDQCESAHVPCVGTIVPWQAWFLGRGGKIGSSAATSTSFKYTYLYFIGLEDELAGQIPAWKELTTNHKVGGLWPSDADGTAFRGAFTKALPGDGYKLTDPGAYQDGATDFTTIINKFKAADVQVVQGCPLPPDFSTFWKQSSSMGYRPKIACIAKAILFPSVVNSLGSLGIVGPNGAGKTTLLDIVAGGRRPDRGQVHLSGRDVTAASPGHRTRLGLGRTYQVPRPFGSMTVFENALVAAVRGAGLRRRAAHQAAYGALERTGLAVKADIAARRLTLLERKRLELARALATQPSVLLLDEIAGGLTEPETDALIATIRAVHAAGTTIVWVEHIMRALTQVVQRVVCLADGQVLFDGTPEQMLRDQQVRRAYLGGAIT